MYRGSPHLRKSGKVDRYLYLLYKKKKWGPQLPSYFLKLKIVATTKKVQAPGYLPTFFKIRKER